MAFVIQQPQAKSLGELLGGGIGSGIQEKIKAMAKEKETEGLLEALGLGAPTAPPQATDGTQAPSAGTVEGQEGTSQQDMSTAQVEKVANSPRAMAMLSQKNKPMADVILKMNENIIRQREHEKKQDLAERKLTQQQKLAYTKINEPLIKTLQDRSTALDKSESEFDRLNKIFTVDADKLPSSFTAAMFNLDGESGLSRFGRSKLSPEAQEMTKLITNQIRGLRDLFPGRILKEEIKLFMKTLPGFLNTKEGKIRILRDLRIMNKIGRLETSSTLEEFRKAGGSGNILHSEAVRRGKQSAEPQIKALRQMFVNHQEQTGESQFTVGQTFEGLPADAPEGAIMSKGNQTFIFRNGRWSKR